MVCPDLQFDKMDEHEQPIIAENTMFKELENLHFYIDDESEVSNEDGEMCSAYLVHEDICEDESDFLSTKEEGGVLLVDEGGEETFFVDEGRCNMDDDDTSSYVNCDELNEDHNSEHAIQIDGDEDIIGIDLESFSPMIFVSMILLLWMLLMAFMSVMPNQMGLVFEEEEC
ncbi:hypothetical protein SESBI_44683 [Sesbania bispinosa]|nr:hypothetical protein SESBI_44683 [Sesbania bispinosa]